MLSSCAGDKILGENQYNAMAAKNGSPITSRLWISKSHKRGVARVENKLTLYQRWCRHTAIDSPLVSEAQTLPVAFPSPASGRTKVFCYVLYCCSRRLYSSLAITSLIHRQQQLASDHTCMTSSRRYLTYIIISLSDFICSWFDSDLNTKISR